MTFCVSCICLVCFLLVYLVLLFMDFWIYFFFKCFLHPHWQIVCFFVFFFSFFFFFFFLLFFFFQAEDGIRDTSVTGVQTCALPILRESVNLFSQQNRLSIYRLEWPPLAIEELSKPALVITIRNKTFTTVGNLCIGQFCRCHCIIRLYILRSYNTGNTNIFFTLI